MSGRTKPPLALPFAVNAKGNPLSHLHNIGVAFDYDPLLQTAVHYDTFLDRIVTEGREWTDADDVRTCMYLQDTHGLSGVSPAMVHAYVQKRAHDRPRHAVLDWLTPIVWDGVPRIETAFETYWQAPIGPDQPEDYVQAISGNFFRSLVARVLKPGCQSDTMAVFEGPQGAGKSSALRILGGPWYAASHSSVANTDFYEALSGKWLLEVGELDSFSRAEVTRVKTAISTPTDRYRAPYARCAEDRPRQCIFAGTTNHDDWGHDETGLRRFWPLKTGIVRLEELARDRDQLFAEALVAVKAGATWWETPASTAAIQRDRQHEHPWTSIVLDYLVGKDEVTSDAILREAIKVPDERLAMKAQQDIGRILRLAGWTKRNAKRNGRVVKAWFSPTYQEPLLDDTLTV